MESSDRQLDSSFTIAEITSILYRQGIIGLEDVGRIKASSDARLQALKKELRTRESQDPYVSPLELISACLATSRRKVDQAEICRGYARAAGLPFVRIDPVKLDARTVCNIVSKPFARKNLLAPIKLEGGRLAVAMVNPFDKEIIRSLEDVTGYKVEPVLATREDVLKTINQIFAFEHSLMKAEAARKTSLELANLEQLVDIAPGEEIDASESYIIQAVDLLLQYAYEQRASDIHLEPKREMAVVRLRIDGRLHTTHSIPNRVYPAFASRIKIMARMDIAEKRRPQDGRIKTSFKGSEVELRISSLPVAFGEKIVIRIFDPRVLMQDISQLGFTPDQLEAFTSLLAQPHGMILVTGPTGSGKTTTLYSALKHLAKPDINITTIEDPIEMVYEAFNQIGVQPLVDLTFANALRHVLRQDPDVIMVGEVRDRETAEYAIQAALTGHLVLTTLHTNSAPSAVTRLRDLGVESFLVASTLLGVVAQRLVRRVCPYCGEPAPITGRDMRLLGIEEEESTTACARRGRGCEKCRNTGYRGRRGVFEVLAVDEKVRALIREGADEKTIARAAGVFSLRRAAVKALLSGETTLEEIVRLAPTGD